MPSLRCLFIVQGEGRGHLTQALALRAVLAEAGHQVGGVLVGHGGQRTLPGYFPEKIDAPVGYFDSPAFRFDGHNRGLRPGSTLVRNVRNLHRFRASLRTIDARVRHVRPDVIINFFEPLAGLYARFCAPPAPVVCIGHQYLFQHPAYVFPPGRPVQRRLLRAYTALTAAGAVRRLALSLYPAPDLPARNLVVMPPLLRPALMRPALLRQPEGTADPFLLVYLLNSGYAGAVMQWHARRPDVRLHCFWDRKDVPRLVHHDATLTFHQLDDETFLSMMARCRGLVCTAGFEAVGEAMYLGKPVLMVPVEGHFEQACNAHDAARAGAGIAAAGFDIDRLLAAAPRCRSDAFRGWVDGGRARILREIEAVAREYPAKRDVGRRIAA